MATGILDNIKEAVQASLNVSQMKNLTTPIIIDGSEYSTVETALNAINSKSATVTIDDALSNISENPIQNKIITEEINKKLTTVDNMPASVNNGAIRLYVGETDANYTKGHIYKYNIPETGVTYKCYKATSADEYIYTIIDVPESGETALFAVNYTMVTDEDLLEFNGTIQSVEADTIEVDGQFFARFQEGDFIAGAGWSDLTSGIKFYQIGNGETLENAVSSKNDDIFFVYKNDGYETMYYLCFRSEVTQNIRRNDHWTVYYNSTVTIITKNRNGQVSSKVFDLSNIELPGAILAYDYSGTIDCTLMLSRQGNNVYGALLKTQNKYQIPALEGLYDSYVLWQYPTVGAIIVSDSGYKYGEITEISDDTYTYKTIANATGTFTQSQISTDPIQGPVYVCNALPITNADDVPARDDMFYTGSEFTFTYLGESFSDSSHGNIQKGHTYFATFDTETNEFIYKDITPASNASGIAYNNTESGLSATNVQSAIDEVNKKVDEYDFTPEVKFIAHRGFCSKYTENSFESLHGAAARNYWGSEFDVWETSDGEYVVMHDSTLNRMTNMTGEISSHTLAEIETATLTGSRFKVPTLKNYLIAAKYWGINPVIELKVLTDASKFVNILKELNLVDSAVIMSFSLDILDRVHAIEPSLKMSYVVDSLSQSIIDTALSHFGSGASVDVEATAVTKDLCEYANSKSIKLIAWTINDKVTYQNYLKWGINMIESESLIPLGSRSTDTEFAIYPLTVEHEDDTISASADNMIIGTHIINGEAWLVLDEQPWRDSVLTRIRSNRLYEIPVGTTNVIINDLDTTVYKWNLMTLDADGVFNTDYPWCTTSSHSIEPTSKYGYLYFARIDLEDLTDSDLENIYAASVTLVKNPEHTEELWTGERDSSGRKIYQKTIVYTTSETAPAGGTIWIPTGVNNIREFFDVKVRDNQNYILPYLMSSSSYDAITGIGRLDAPGSRIGITVYNDSWGARTWYATIKYTKSN